MPRGARTGLAVALGLLMLSPGAEAAAPDGPLPTASAAPARKLAAEPYRVFHLNCGTMAPPSAWLVNGEGAWFGPGRLVTHCLLIETERGLVLVDTGIGTADVEQADRRFNWGWFVLIRPRLALEETARHQIERLGFRAADVTDVVLTHVDVDHVGGLADFPQARVHLTERELARVERGADRLGRLRWSHGPRWVPHTLTPGSWYGFASARLWPSTRPEIRLVGLPGHSAGHAGVAVRRAGGWLLHAGDAYYHRGELAAERPHSPPALDLMHRTHTGTEQAAVEATQKALRRLVRAPGAPVRVISAHDPQECAAVTAEGLKSKLAAIRGPRERKSL